MLNSYDKHLIWYWLAN